MVLYAAAAKYFSLSHSNSIDTTAVAKLPSNYQLWSQCENMLYLLSSNEYFVCASSYIGGFIMFFYEKGEARTCCVADVESAWICVIV